MDAGSAPTGEVAETTMKTLKSESGNVLVLTALSFLVLMGFVAVAVDAGMLYRAKRNMQKVADAAALSAAAQISSDSTGQGPANTAATQNGFSIGTSAGTVTMTPQILTPSSSLGYIQVTATEHTPTFFVPLFNSKFGLMDISATGGASYTLATSNECMLALSPTGTAVPNYNGVETDGSTTMIWGTTIMADVAVTGSAKISAPHCGVQACGPSTEVSGSGKTAAALYAAGSGNIDASSTSAPSWGTDNSGSSVKTTPTIKSCSGNPMASSMPTPPTPSSTCSDPTWMQNNGQKAGGGTYTISPGTYCNFNTSNVKALTMSPGMYIISQTFSTNSGTTITGNGVTIYLANGVDANSANGYGVGNGTTMNLSSPTSTSNGGVPGVTIWDGNSSASTPDTFTFGGGASSTFNGAIYAPNTNLFIGNNSGNTTLSSNILANTITVVGSGTITNNYNPSSSSSSSSGTGTGVTLAQ
jgi:Flp pilus assembly protein TadG